MDVREPKLTIQMVTWNSTEDLPPALATLKALPLDEVVIRIIDNDSSDSSLDLVRRELPTADVVSLPENRGFSGAHNRGLMVCETELVMLHNPDLVLNWPGVQSLLEAFDDMKLGAVQGLLMRDTGERAIDSAGIVKTLALNGRERGAGEVDEGQYDREEDLLAVTGASGIYRLGALREIAHADGEIFDEDFFAYKEDVDVGWRLNRAGWKVKYVPVLQGVHTRAARREGVGGWGLHPTKIMRRARDPITRYSLRSWVWMVAKNASLKDAIVHELFFDLRLMFFVVLSLAYWPLFSIWREIWRGLPKMMQKRA